VRALATTTADLPFENLKSLMIAMAPAISTVGRAGRSPFNQTCPIMAIVLNTLFTWRNCPESAIFPHHFRYSINPSRLWFVLWSGVRGYI